jgi:hypothetical protein
MNGGPVASVRFDDTLANDSPFFLNGPKQPYTHDPCGASARFDDPRALAVSSDGVIFVVDYKNHVVREVRARDVM